MRVIGSLGKVFIAAVMGIAAFAQAPSGLTVKAATNRRVDLTWSGTEAAYTVQRRVLGSGSYSSIAGSVASASYSDTGIDPYTTYQYQVIANLSSGASLPSNAVTVGPPPSGFTTAAPAPGPEGGPASNNYGYNLSVTLDDNGDPAFAFIFYDPNLDSDPADTRIEFRSWNRATYKWKDVVHVVANLGDTGTTFHQVLSLAYDATTNMFAIAAENGDGNLLLYLSSDGGGTWTKKTTIANENASTSPSMAFYNGTIHLAYVVDHEGLKYVTGKLNADPSTWQTKSETKVAGVDRAQASVTISLALDVNGNPAIVWFANDLTKDYNTIVQFWKPLGGAGPVKVLDSQNEPSGDVAAKLVFAGLNPRMLVAIARPDSVESGRTVRSVKSDDGGTTWAAPVQLPPEATGAQIILSIWRWTARDRGRHRSDRTAGRIPGCADFRSFRGPTISSPGRRATWRTIYRQPGTTRCFQARFK